MAISCSPCRSNSADTAAPCVGPISTAIGVALLNAVFAEVATRLQASGTDAPIYLSANMPGAAEINARLVERYRPRNPHL